VARVVDASDSFLAWSAAASLLDRLASERRPEARRSVRVALTGSYTTAQLGAMLRLAALREGIDLLLFEGDYGQYRQDLIGPASSLYAFDPAYVIIAIHEGALQLPAFSHSPDDDVAAELDRWQSLWRTV
jgi:predicted enzyme involved in methoxymalonyl-ACP biosynthesis